MRFSKTQYYYQATRDSRKLSRFLFVGLKPSSGLSAVNKVLRKHINTAKSLVEAENCFQYFSNSFTLMD